jgi:hypothetical protein
MSAVLEEVFGGVLVESPEPMAEDCDASADCDEATQGWLCCVLDSGHPGAHNDPIDGPWLVVIASRLRDET